jgi:hypothetical protein
MRLSKYSRYFVIALFIVPLVLLQSCKKNAATMTIRIAGEDAIILNTGDIAADGCGWQIKIADSYYSPKNLADQFKVDSLKVRIDYHELKTRFYCSQIANNPGNGIPEIQIDGIVKR